MDRLRTQNVKYAKAFAIDPNDGQKLTQYGTEKVYTSAVKRYNGVLYDLLALRHSERIMLDWFTENMDKNNEVFNNKTIRDRIRSDHENALTRSANAQGLRGAERKKFIKPLSDVSMIKAIGRLTKMNLLIKKARGVYVVNPKYFFRGKESERIKRLKVVLEIPAWEKFNAENPITVEVEPTEKEALF